MLHSGYCAVHSVNCSMCIVYNVQCVMNIYIIHYSVCIYIRSVQCTLCAMHYICTLYTIHSVQCTGNCIQYTVYIVHCIVYTLYRIIYLIYDYVIQLYILYTCAYYIYTLFNMYTILWLNVSISRLLTSRHHRHTSYSTTYVHVCPRHYDDDMTFMLISSRYLYTENKRWLEYVI